MEVPRWSDVSVLILSSMIQGPVPTTKPKRAHVRWPYKFVHGLMEKMLERKQINVQSNTAVVSITDEKDSEGYFTVKTKRGEMKAKTIVHANVRLTLGEIEGSLLMTEPMGRPTSARAQRLGSARPEYSVRRDPCSPIREEAAGRPDLDLLGR